MLKEKNSIVQIISRERRFPLSKLQMRKTSLLGRKSHPFSLLNPLCTTKPTNAILGIYLRPWLQDRLMQAKVIHGASAKDAESWKQFAGPIHERAALRTEEVCHLFAGGGGCRLAEFCESFFAARVLEIGFCNDKICCEHRCSYFAAVRTVAGKCVNEARPFCWLEVIHGISGNLVTRGYNLGAGMLNRQYSQISTAQYHNSMQQSLDLRLTSHLQQGQQGVQKIWIYLLQSQ